MSGIKNHLHDPVVVAICDVVSQKMNSKVAKPNFTFCIISNTHIQLARRRQQESSECCTTSPILHFVCCRRRYKTEGCRYTAPAHVIPPLPQQHVSAQPCGTFATSLRRNVIRFRSYHPIHIPAIRGSEEGLFSVRSVQVVELRDVHLRKLACSPPKFGI